jgi:exonuclease SbcC
MVPKDGLDVGLTQKITSDRLVCRKFVVPVNGESIDRILETLPFWRPSELEGDAVLAQRLTVDEVLLNANFDTKFLKDLGKRGPDTVAAQIAIGAYELRTARPQKESAASSPESPRTIARSTSEKLPRVCKLTVKDFRGFGQLTNLDTDADVVFFYGPNGCGKTSLFDAIEWATTGRVARLSLDPDADGNPFASLINVFSKSGEAKVSIELSTGDRITRTLRRGEEDVVSQLNDAVVTDVKITKAVIGHDKPSELNQKLVPDLIRRSHLLGQDNIREFINGRASNEDPKITRFDAVSKMIGSEEYVKRRHKIQRVEAELRKKTTEQEEIVKQAEQNLASLDQQLSSKRNSVDQRRRALQGLSAIDTEFRSFAQMLNAEGLVTATSVEDITTSPDMRLRFIDDAERILSALFESLQTQIAQVVTLEAETQRQSDRKNVLAELEQKIGETNGQIASEQSKLSAATIIVDQKRQALIRARETEGAKRDALHKLDLLRDRGPVVLDSRKTVGEAEIAVRSVSSDLETLNRDSENLVQEKQTVDNEWTQTQTKSESLENRYLRLRSLRTSLSPWRQITRELKELQAKRDTLDITVRNQRQTMESDAPELADMNRRLATMTAEINALQQQRNRKAELLSQLLPYVDSPLCPFCGHDHGSEEGLNSAVNIQMQNLPDMVVRLSSQREELVNQIATADNRHRQFSQSLTTNERDLVQLEQQISSHMDSIARWRSDAIELGLLSLESNMLATLEDAQVALDENELRLMRESVSQIGTRMRDVAQRLSNVAEVRREYISKLQTAQQAAEVATAENRRLESELSQRNVTLEQDYDPQITAHQRAAVASEIEATLSEINSMQRELDIVISQCSTLESLVARLRSDLEAYRVQRESILKEDQDYAARLAAHQLPPEAGNEEIHGKRREYEGKLKSAASLKDRCGKLQAAVEIGQIEDEIRLEENRRQEVIVELERLKHKLSNLRTWNEELGSCAMVLGGEQSRHVEEQLEAFAPTINLVYKRLSPHPVFGPIRLQVVPVKDAKEKALRITAEVEGSEVAIESDSVTPYSFFSEAQLNVLCLSIFLACALRQSWSGFRLIGVDDPVQQMDDLNANALFDLIRGLVPLKRQFFVATCDLRLYRMALEKFACLNAGHSRGFLAYRLEAGAKLGPRFIIDAPVATKV